MRYALAMAEVSIIVPVYNVEKYLSFCLDSIINQTFKDIEILCVNDGSTDNSPTILEHYANFDKRIKIINKPNGGLSSARNAGIDGASGKYIAFVDSDDFVSHFFLEKTLGLLKKYNADFVSFMFSSVVGNNLKMYGHNVTFDNLLTEKALTEKQLPGDFYTKIHPTAWCKLYSADLIRRNNLKFTEDIVFEDLPFAAEIFFLAKKMVFTNLAPYYYRVDRQGSIMAKKDEKMLDFVKSINAVDAVFEKYHRFEKYKNSMLIYKLQLAVYCFTTINEACREKFFYTLKDYFSKFDFREYNRKQLEKDNNYKIISLILSCNYASFCKAVKNYA